MKAAGFIVAAVCSILIMAGTAITVISAWGGLGIAVTLFFPSMLMLGPFLVWAAEGAIPGLMFILWFLMWGGMFVATKGAEDAT